MHIINLKDSIDAQEYDQNVAEISEKYEAEKKEQQIELLQTENELQETRLQQQKYFLGAAALFALLMLAIGYRICFERVTFFIPIIATWFRSTHKSFNNQSHGDGYNQEAYNLLPCPIFLGTSFSS